MRRHKQGYTPPPTNKPIQIGSQINNVDYPQYRELPHKSLKIPYISYGVGTAGYGAIGGVVGYITREGLILIGDGLDKLRRYC